MKWVLTPTGAFREGDERKMQESVRWVREWANEGSVTYRFALDPEDPGQPWAVAWDDRGHNPMETLVGDTFATEEAAQSAADCLNADIAADIAECFDRVDLPENVKYVDICKVEDGRHYPQDRRCEIVVTLQDSTQLSIWAHWAARIGDFDVNTSAVKFALEQNLAEAIVEARDRSAALATEE